MGIEQYRNTQNITDSGKQLSIRVVRSILLYCNDWSNKSLSKAQRLQSVQAGQVLCDAIIENMIDTIPEKEAKLLMTIFAETSIDLFECTMNDHKSLIQNEQALLNILRIMEKPAGVQHKY